MADWSWKRFFKFLLMVAITIFVVLTIIFLYTGLLIPLRID